MTTTDYWAVAFALVIAASVVVVFLLAERDKRRELKRLEKVFPASGEQDDN